MQNLAVVAMFFVLFGGECLAQGYKDFPGRPRNRPVGADGFVKGDPCITVPANSVVVQGFLDCVLKVGSFGNPNGLPFPCYSTRETPSYNECAPEGPLVCQIDFNAPIKTVLVEWRCDITLRCNQTIAIRTVLATDWVADGCR